MEYISNLEKATALYKEELVLQRDLRVVKDKHIIGSFNKKIVPGVYQDINQGLQQLRLLYRETEIELNIIKDKIMLTTNDKYKSKYNNLLQSLQKIQHEIEQIELYKTLLDKKYVVHTPKVTNYKEFEESKKQTITRPTYLVKELPRITEHIEKPSEVRKEALVKKQAKLTESQVKIIRKNIKDLIKEKFKPKTLEECASQKRSQPYYMKKEDIVATIEDTPEIKSMMPANYKTLSKEKICTYLYDK